MADKYILKVTAGPTYDAKDQSPVHVNTDEATQIDTSSLSSSLRIRIQNYRGLPTSSPKTCAYFDHPPHTADLYSIDFSFTPKRDIKGQDLVFGNDFDHPIRDKLPPGFGQAMKIAQWFIDPGLYGDVYADEPYLYGPFLSSINTLRVGGKGENKKDQEKFKGVEEGGDGDGVEERKKRGLPEDAVQRKKWALKKEHLEKMVFEEGRTYEADFFNPYLDFNDFAVKLPGFSYIPGITIPIISYWDGQPLRYVLKDRSTNEVLFVIIFSLIPKDDADKEAETTDAATKTDETKEKTGDEKKEDDDLD